MHEIDPQSDVRLTEALRRLGASSPQTAPPELGAGLLTEFRRYHARRRWIRCAATAALAACVLMAAQLLIRTPSHPRPDSGVVTVAAPQISKQISGKTVAPHAAALPTPTTVKHSSTKPKAPTAPTREFVALPAYDPAIPIDELRVVRVRLPASALWQMGAPLNSDTADRRMLADFVVGQDGTPYAVRLLQ
jgi:hypothetical protein